jgi:hypothetical protein
MMARFKKTTSLFANGPLLSTFAKRFSVVRQAGVFRLVLENKTESMV